MVPSLKFADVSGTGRPGVTGFEITCDFIPFVVNGQESTFHDGVAKHRLHRSDVVTINGNSGPVKQGKRSGLAFILMSRRILYVQFTDPAGYPPIEHSSRLFAERGWEVFMVGVETAGALNLKLPDHPRIRVKKFGFVGGGWRQKLQYIRFLIFTLYWTWWWRPSWIYASETLSCPVVWLVKKLNNINVVYHEHDSPSTDRTGTWFMNAALGYRAKLARNAELCVLPEQARLLEFLETTERTKLAFCVWNCPRPDEIAHLNSNSNPDRELIIYYHGSITSARLPPQLIIAASRFKGGVRVRVAGYETLGSIGYLRELTTLAAKNGAADMVEPLGTFSRREDLFRSASKAHVGLSLMPKYSEDINMRHMVGASNKPFDYMAAGLPLLVSDLPEWVATFVKPGYGRSCDPEDPDSIEAALRWYIDHPQKRREMGRKGQDKIREAWNYESMFADVLAEIEGRSG